MEDEGDTSKDDLVAVLVEYVGQVLVLDSQVLVLVGPVLVHITAGIRFTH